MQESFDTASSQFQLAAGVAEFAEILRKSYWAKDSSCDAVLQTLQALPSGLRNEAKVIELMDLLNKAINVKTAD